MIFWIRSSNQILFGYLLLLCESKLMMQYNLKRACCAKNKLILCHRIIFRITLVLLVGVIGPIVIRSCFSFKTVFNRNWRKIMIFDIKPLVQSISFCNNEIHNTRNGNLKVNLFLQLNHQTWNKFEFSWELVKAGNSAANMAMWVAFNINWQQLIINC